LLRASYVLILAIGTVLATAPPTSAEEERPGFAYGAIVHTLDDAHFAREAGFTVISAYVAWAAVEPNRGDYIFEQTDRWGRTQPNDLTNVLQAARANGLRVGLRLDAPPDWAGGAVYRLNPADVDDYVYHVVRYAGATIAYIEVFNELNLPLEWGTSPVDPAAYAPILAGAYRGAKRANPTVTVVSGAPSQRTGGLGGTMEDVDWLSGLYAAGGGRFFDALGVHAYLGSFDPETDPSCTPLCFRDLELYRAVMELNGDTAKRGLITEMGSLEQATVDLGPYAWMELPTDTRADYLVQALRKANADYPWLVGATVFNLDYASSGALPSTSERFWFSLLNPDLSPRQAYVRFQQARASGALP
jgi:hypothetical protein